jgi:hypothetical protein
LLVCQPPVTTRVRVTVAALRAVDVVRVPQPDSTEVVAGQCSLAAGDVELDERFSGGGDVEDFSLAAVLDALYAWLVVLFDHRYPVALVDAVVNTGHLHF